MQVKRAVIAFLLFWQVNSVCAFDSSQLPHCLALASENSLTIGTIDDIQKLHIQVPPARPIILLE